MMYRWRMKVSASAEAALVTAGTTSGPVVPQSRGMLDFSGER